MNQTEVLSERWMKIMSMSDYMLLPVRDFDDPYPIVGQRYRWGQFRISRYLGDGTEMWGGETVTVQRWRGYKVEIR